MLQGGSNKIRVLVVDDSIFMRSTFSSIINCDPELEVVGTAHDGEEGLRLVHELSPDLVTMDIEMPRMDGLTALHKIMKEKPTPVIMVSALSTTGAQATFDALEIGALDFVPLKDKSSRRLIDVGTDLVSKIKLIGGQGPRLMTQYRLRSSRRRDTVRPKPSFASDQSINSFEYSQPKQVVAIGLSTGGPLALLELFSALPSDFPAPILVAQHMPGGYTAILAERLNARSALPVNLAESGVRIEAGSVYVAPGDSHMSLKGRDEEAIIALTAGADNLACQPSVDILMNSAAEIFGKNALGVIMIGMGRDGLEGLRRIKARGGRVIAQDEASAVVYGMPRAAVETGLADEVVSVDRLAARLCACCRPLADCRA